jgi:hypothetical protein
MRSIFACFVVLIVAGFAVGDEGISEAPITDDDREHWSFRLLKRPAVPDVSPPDWARSPIDHFILAKLQAKNLTPQPQADPVVLIRRLSFDLIGLPPTPEELAEFAAASDRDPDSAFHSLVDRLLASHHYGERSAQHWLDLARFAETDGFEHDKVRGEAWKYRDWVIAALNEDMPYDRFVALQLAGDELSPDDPNGRIATTFCLSGPDMPDINSQEERLHNVLNELTGAVGSVLLGLQVGCAQCHDHKYDPVSQADFYRLRSIFEPAVHVKKNESLNVLTEKEGVIPESHLMIRGDWQRKGPEVTPAFPRIANLTDEDFAPATVKQTSGRRAALATWLARPDNPLTARVIANRIWQYHFGAGLSRTPSDFGIIGEEPSHPELLDWLACELIEHDWSLKHLHRLIITSATYQQSSSNAQSAIHDPQSTWLSHFPRRRLSGEAIRDAMFAASGTLNLQQRGRGVMPPLPAELVATLLKNQWKASDREADHYRRSIYVFARRNLRYPIFDEFDRPDGNASCPRRSRSTTAPQSLLLLNSEFSLDAARRLAGTVLTEHGRVSDDAIINVVRRAFGRGVNADELNVLRLFVEEQTKLLQTESRPPDELALPLPCPAEVGPSIAAAFTDLCLALLNSNEFVYLD